MAFETTEREYGVEEFYHQYKSQLPKIVMVNQGFYDLGEDTFSREQVLRLHTTRRYQRVLVRSHVGKVKKTYSMSINYPKKFCLVDQAGYEQSLYAIVRDNTLPVKVRLSYNQTVLINGEQINARKIPDMELIELFTEICFLGTDIDKSGNMSPGMTKLSLCLDKIKLKVVTGIVGISKREWREKMGQWNKESKYVAFDEEQGIEDLAHYDETQFQRNTDISKVEPALYTNLSLLISRKSTSSTFASESLQQTKDDAVYELVGQVQSTNKGESRTQPDKPVVNKRDAERDKPTGLVQELTAAMKKVKKNVIKGATKQKDQTNTHTKDLVTRPKEKPKVAPKPKVKRKAPQSNQSVATISRVQDLELEDTSTTDDGYGAYDDSIAKWGTIEPKVYDPESDYDTAKERKLNYEQDIEHVEVYFRTSDADLQIQSDSRYINIDSMAIVTPMSYQDEGATYANFADIRQQRTQVRNIRSISQPMTSRQSTRLKLSQEEIHELSIDAVGEYLRRLKLDTVIDAFRENQIDGKLLTELTDDILKTEFHLKPVQVLKLKAFTREGHIPQ